MVAGDECNVSFILVAVVTADMKIAIIFRASVPCQILC